MHDENVSLVEPFAELMLGSIWLDILLLGAGAISGDGRIYTYDIGEATLNARMIGRASRVFVLADSSKFGQTATIAVAPIPAGATVVTDSGLSTEWRARLADHGVEVIVSDAKMTE